MRTRPLLFGTLALAACGGGEAQLDIDSLASAGAPMVPSAGPDKVVLDINVSGGQLAPVLDRGGADLRIVDCAAPEGPGETVPVYFGGEALSGLRGSQVSGDREMTVQLQAAVPRTAPGAAPRCARFVGREGAMMLRIVSRPVPLPPG